MMVINRVPELVAAKFGGKENINISEVVRETGMTFATASSWIKGHVTRAEFDTLDTWCKYLGVKPGDILGYEAGQK